MREDYDMRLIKLPNPAPKTSEYDQEMQQRQTTEHPTAPRERA